MADTLVDHAGWIEQDVNMTSHVHACVICLCDLQRHNAMHGDSQVDRFESVHYPWPRKLVSTAFTWTTLHQRQNLVAQVPGALPHAQA